MLINPKGSKSAPVWVVVEIPLSTDKDRGYIFSGGLGHMWDSMMKDAGFAFGDYYVTARAPDPEHRNSFINVFGELNQHRPPFVIALDKTGFHFCDQFKIKNRQTQEEDAELSKYCGSLLTCPQLIYPHYVLPTYGPSVVAAQYKMRDTIVYCDLAKVKSELDYYRANNCTIQPLPQRDLRIKFDTLDEIIATLHDYRHYSLLSNDIETVYPRRGTSAKTTSLWYKKHPGYPITIGLAPANNRGISFDLFRSSDVETRCLWRALNDTLRAVPQLGQNFFNFDLCFYEMLGFEINPKWVQDTLIRHHILWPELSHKLQFMTRQYTREVYYKDEGHGWGGKDLDRLKRYNALDCCATYEIYEEQEKEFDERPHLK